MLSQSAAYCVSLADPLVDVMQIDFVAVKDATSLLQKHATPSMVQETASSTQTLVAWKDKRGSRRCN